MSHLVDFETLKKLKPGTFTADGKPHMVQQHPITCLDGLTNVEYQPGDEWTQTRIFDNGPTTGMEGQFRFVIFSKTPMHRKNKIRFVEDMDTSTGNILNTTEMSVTRPTLKNKINP